MNLLLFVVSRCVPKPGLLHGHTLCRREVGDGQDTWGLGSDTKENSPGSAPGSKGTVRFLGRWPSSPSLESGTVPGPMKERLEGVLELKFGL